MKYNNFKKRSHRSILLLIIALVYNLIFLSSCVLIEPKRVILTEKQKEEYLAIALNIADHPPEPSDEFSYKYYSDTKDFDYRVYDNQTGYILRKENQKVYYKDGDMYN